jgi:hypothetical protein
MVPRGSKYFIGGNTPISFSNAILIADLEEDFKTGAKAVADANSEARNTVQANIVKMSVW